MAARSAIDIYVCMRKTRLTQLFRPLLKRVTFVVATPGNVARGGLAGSTASFAASSPRLSSDVSQIIWPCLASKQTAKFCPNICVVLNLNAHLPLLPSHLRRPVHPDGNVEGTLTSHTQATIRSIETFPNPWVPPRRGPMFLSVCASALRRSGEISATNPVFRTGQRSGTQPQSGQDKAVRMANAGYK